MSNYKDKQSWTVNNLALEVHPYVSSPDNLFDHPAIQYGADFKVCFTRTSGQVRTALIQLILPRTQIFPHTVVGSWNVDKRNSDNSSITMGGCLYSSDGVSIGNHSEHYQGEQSRFISELSCWLIDTPRELSASFSPEGSFTGQTSTKFANYVVELDGRDGVIFNPGIVWGYSVTQNATKPYEFDMTLLAPIEIRLKDTNEHLDTIATFLGKTKSDIKAYIS